MAGFSIERLDYLVLTVPSVDATIAFYERLRGMPGVVTEASGHLMHRDCATRRGPRRVALGQRSSWPLPD